MNRAERRAAERNRLTLAAAAAKTTAASTTTISEAQLAANRANAQLSTGPRSEATKSISSMNALKTGLTGRTVLLPTDDAAIYQTHIARIFKKYSPANDDEKALIQSIADTEWRLLRIAPLEAGYYALGRQKLADSPTILEAAPENREALIQTLVFDLYRKELNNLALQERRLRNHRKEDIAEFEKLHAENKRERSAHREIRYNAASQARKALENARRMGKSINLADFGFDFSESELTAYFEHDETYRSLLGTPTPPDFDTFLAKHRAEQTKTEAQAA